MSPRYIRTPPERKEEVAAAAISAALGVGVGLVAYYFVRLMLSREPLAGGSRDAREESSPEA
ncbi:MAG TPA: hypothetical protein VMM35_09990 [Longimicrobiales bacterium]|nr:hypothetical protein [Longimicrobiales bacterium]